MYPNTASPQYQQQQQPYPAAPYAGAPGYGGTTPAPSTPQPIVINIQQNASTPDKKNVPPPTVAETAPVKPALPQKASRKIMTFCN